MGKKLILILGILIICDICYFSFVNHGTAVSFNYKPLIDSFSLDKGLSIFLLALYSFLGAYLVFYGKISDINQKLKKQTRTSEKASLDSEESSDKVKQLEAKIQTLEIALKSALEKK